MLNFESDYIYGAHSKVLEKLINTNFEPLSGYGDDKYTESAKQKIKALCGENTEVFFLSGGTQTNQLVIDSVLDPTEGVVCADTGHINYHEAGAIEFCGHKIFTLPNKLGKILSHDLNTFVEDFYSDENHNHCVCPGMVYISHPTEYGTLYTLDELKDISEVCKKHNLPLYLDGARLGYGLMSSSTDVTIKDIASLCDAFYIGGTKVGALCSEALVFTSNNVPKRFFTQIKQHGALLAKGRLHSVQFDALFTDDLYFKISKHAIDMADKLRQGLKDKGYEIFIPTTTNQIFVVLDNKNMERLRKLVKFGFWERLDDNRTVVRFATCWATKSEDLDKLLDVL